MCLQYGVGVPPGFVAKSPEEAESVAKKLSMTTPKLSHAV